MSFELAPKVACVRKRTAAFGSAESSVHAGGAGGVLRQERGSIAAALHRIELERDRLAQPRRIDRVVIDHVVGQRVDKDVETLAVQHQPRHNSLKLLVLEDHLELRHRMRAYPLAAIGPKLDIEPRAELLFQLFRDR